MESEALVTRGEAGTEMVMLTVVHWTSQGLFAVIYLWLSGRIIG
jgi:hypothetical protein